MREGSMSPEVKRGTSPIPMPAATNASTTRRSEKRWKTRVRWPAASSMSCRMRSNGMPSGTLIHVSSTTSAGVR